MVLEYKRRKTNGKIGGLFLSFVSRIEDQISFWAQRSIMTVEAIPCPRRAF